MGGWTPLGYEARDRKLIIHEPDAERVRSIFRRFIQLRSATLLERELVAASERNRYGHLLDKGVLYKPLNNRVYIGEAVHKGTSYPGEHDAIIDRDLWDQVHAILKESPRKRANNARAQSPALLRGLLFGPDGAAMSPTHTRKSGRLYRYYTQPDWDEARRIGLSGPASARGRNRTHCCRPDSKAPAIPGDHRSNVACHPQAAVRGDGE